MKLGDLQVIVLCNGRPLEEYHFEQDGINTATCYIPSEAGKAFKVHTTNTTAVQPFVGKLKLDGFRVRTFRAMPLSSHIADCVYLSQSVQRPFLFSEMAAVDGDTVAPDTEYLNSIGTIQIDFFRCELGPEAPWFSRGVKDISVGQVPDGCDAHQATLGNSEYVRNKRISGTRAKLLDPKEWPYAQFTFRYQSREILEAHGIIPRPLNIALSLPRRSSANREIRRTTLPTISESPSSSRIRRPAPHPDSMYEPRSNTLNAAQIPTSSSDLMNDIDSWFDRAMMSGKMAQARRKGRNKD